MIYCEDALAKLKTLEDNSIHSLITDPPAGISFMGKNWDTFGKKEHNAGYEQEHQAKTCGFFKTNGTSQVNTNKSKDPFIDAMTEIFKECLRVLKPGAHGLVWALPRTSHWTATALENAGFEVRDVITHLFGSGFPKSFNLGNGFGTALKPASEHWVLIRKPISEDTIAKNVLKHGVGGINIDGCRIEGQPRNPGFVNPSESNRDMMATSNTKFIGYQSPEGRFPANLVLDEEAAEMLDEQSLAGGMHSAGSKRRAGNANQDGAQSLFLGEKGSPNNGIRFGDSGGASRFFYCAKASKRERNEGLEGMPLVAEGIGDPRPSGQSMQRLDGREPRQNQNHHPTVKPLKLMEYLITLITPPNGIVLDPFMGSGSTGVAAKRLGFEFIGIEKEKEYFDIAEKRIG